MCLFDRVCITVIIEMVKKMFVFYFCVIIINISASIIFQLGFDPLLQLFAEAFVYLYVSFFQKIVEALGLLLAASFIIQF